MIENHLVRDCHFGTHRITAEDHPSVENRWFADRPVKLAALDRKALPALRAGLFQPRSNLLPEMVC